MSADLNRPAAAALRLAVDRFVGQEATPQVCVRIKKAFIQIMREQFGVDWSRHAWQIQVSFVDGKKPNLHIPPRLLMRT
ncbi:hypothetical protein [Paraburkholderia sp. SOS3]|uniref:hypothetical protein n=1 Tax=Paraburkholderia sp. SOS3 TaxID=1926494 RepID=UPI0009477F65|nr:hypothetical protein [Paraburkholderia sp. SOS3]APR40031.1 hypothetical protein BTO02_33360 [Paraburkholderia sp. SOS3]